LHRKWLKANNVDYSGFDDEQKFVKVNEKLGLVQRADMRRLSKAVEYAAKTKAHAKIIKMRVQNKLVEKVEKEQLQKQKFCKLDDALQEQMRLQSQGQSGKPIKPLPIHKNA